MILPDMTEENPKLHAVVSLLTTGPVGVGDRIGYTDVNLVRRRVFLSTFSTLGVHIMNSVLLIC